MSIPTSNKPRVLLDRGDRSIALFGDSISGLELNSMDDVRCRDGRYVLLFGHSGYTTTPMRCEICRWEMSWRNHAGDHFGDGGDKYPLGWLPVPSFITPPKE